MEISSYTLADLASMERFYRANLLNSLSGCKATHLVATCNAEGVPNLALFHNIIHMGADPALIGMLNRPLAAAPHTIANIEATGCWSLNSVHPAILAQAHQCSAKYAVGVNEFEATGLTPWQPAGCPVPLVAESALKYLLKLEEIIPIRQNGTYFIIGSIQQLWIANGLLGSDGFLALDKADVVVSAGLDAYFTPQALGRYSYAKPGVLPTKIG